MPFRVTLVSLRFHFELTSISLPISLRFRFDFTSISLRFRFGSIPIPLGNEFISISLRSRFNFTYIHIGSTSKPHRFQLRPTRFHFPFTSHSPRYHVGSKPISLRLPHRMDFVRMNFDPTSVPFRWHFDVTSNYLRVHFDSVSASLRLSLQIHIDLTSISLRDSLRNHCDFSI